MGAGAEASTKAPSTSTSRAPWSATVSVAALFLLTLLLLTPTARADYEQMPEHFGASGEAEQLANAAAMAVNEDGAGGVPAGSLYVVGGNNRVLRFTPGKEGEEPAFREAWGWGVGSGEEGAPPEGFQRCGPALATEPAQHTFHTCSPANSNAAFGGEEIGHFETLAGVAVDQATGDVYVLGVHNGPRKRHLIQVFTATGTPVGEGFADAGKEPNLKPGEESPAEWIEEGPEKLHSMFITTGAIEVDEAGTVYVNDADYNGLGGFEAQHPQARVLSFEPETPGDYEHYVYAGQDKDLVVPITEKPARLSLIAGGRLVAANAEWIREYQIGAGNTPLCNLTVKGQLKAMTANPLTGEVFYFTFVDSKLRRLNACNEGTGKFTEAQAFKPLPLTQGIEALAFNPSLSWGPLRPAGVLYVADGLSHKAQLGIGDVFAGAKAPPQTLSVAKTGSGTGKVTSIPAGIDCGATCSAEFAEGSTVTLTATADEGSEFSAWSGECAAVTANKCKVTMSAARSVTAEFSAASGTPKFKLSVSKLGSGTGKVTSTPSGIDCGATCSFAFDEGTEVELKEAAEAGSEFKEWGGACSGSGTCKVAMSAAKEVTAEFKAIPKPKFALKVKRTGTGTGKVESTSPLSPKIVCGSECEAEYEEGTKVTLTQGTEAGSKFTEWGGACSGSGACEVTMSEAKEVTARFDLIPKFKLSVAKTGTGTGKVSSTPAGISCDPTCSAEYEEGTEVELKETPEAGSEFKEWTGACTGSGSCKVKMSEARSVSAKFDLIPKAKFALKVKRTGTGTGKVESTSPLSPKISCGSECEAEYEEGTKVALTQSADAGSEFVKWEGACTGSGACEVTISAAKEVSAKFDLIPKPKFALKVKRTGTGTGKVESTSPLSPKISCGTECEKEFEEGTKVTLTQSAEAGSKFTEWGGACSGSGSCEVTMSAAKEVTAKFDLVPKFKLSVSKTGTGLGTITSTPAGIDCGPTCGFEYESGKEVELKASADAGSEFVKWGGACSGSGTCKVTMSAAKEASAEFKLLPKPKFKLSVTKPGSGQGTVTSSPAGINCGSVCSAEYEEGKVVELKAEANPGSEFTEWTGACAGSGSCKVTMSAAKAVGARFDALPSFKLTVSVSGTGAGTVISDPAGIECPSACEAFFEEGTEVALEAIPEEGSEFKEWKGACIGQGTCQVTMSSAKAVSAVFKATPTYRLLVQKSGTGGGRVTSSPEAIDCGSQCEAKLPLGTEVLLTATPDPGSEFFKWSGACNGTGPCEVTMGAARTVHATFKEVPHFALSVTKSGSGSVTSSPAGIDCGTECQHEYSAGTAITLTATPAHGYRFKGWGGCDSASGTTCTLTINGPRSVGATFVLGKCKKGFHRKKANGKPRCVKTRRHAHRQGARNSLALPAFWP